MNVQRQSKAPAPPLPEPADDPDALFDGRPDAEPDAAPDEHEALGADAGPCASAVGEAELVGWIERIAAHDDRALGALYDATLSRVYGLVLRIVRRTGLAEEVVEDTYFQVWRQAVRFDPQRGRALTWLLGMARSRAIDALRREARFEAESLDADGAGELEDTGGGGDVDELLAVAQDHAALHRALLTLGPQPRQLVALAFFRGLSHEEIATQTALPLGTVKSQIRRALIALKDVLGDVGRPAWNA